MANRISPEAAPSFSRVASRTKPPLIKDPIITAKAWISKNVSQVLILDPELAHDLIQERQNRGSDRHDEVWEGVYVMHSTPRLIHQELVHLFSAVLHVGIVEEGRGKVYPGINVSDRRSGWKQNFRVPDVVVVLKNSRAIPCDSHFYGGPDFLVEIHSPGDEIEKKIPFYSQIQVRELFIVHRDNRKLTLYRHDGKQLAQVGPTNFQGGKWLLSEVVPLAFRQKTTKAGPRTQLRRTDGKPGNWVI